MTRLTSISLLVLAGLFLTACGQKYSQETRESVPKTKQTQVAKKSDQATQVVDESSAEEAVGQVTDNGAYFSVSGKYGPVIIVNKKYPLSPDYAPGEDPQALSAFWELILAMQDQGFAISDAYSGFRSYEHQASLYQNYVNRDGQAAADRYSARPGHSEHQTGLAFDLLDSDGQLLEEPVASAWLANNAHHYGFVVRYLPGKEDVTGYMAESWHVRYIGPEAKDIYQSGLTLEEYYGVPGGDYN